MQASLLPALETHALSTSSKNVSTLGFMGIKGNQAMRKGRNRKVVGPKRTGKKMGA